MHRFSVIDAIETAANYIHGQSSEFAHVEAGSKAKTILGVLPQFVPHTAKDGQIGWLGNRKVVAVKPCVTGGGNVRHPELSWHLQPERYSALFC